MTRGGGPAALVATAFVLSVGAFIRGGLDLPIRSHPKRVVPQWLLDTGARELQQFNAGDCEALGNGYSKDAVTLLDPDVQSDFKVGRAPVVAFCKEIYQMMKQYDTKIKSFELVKWEYQGDDVFHVVSRTLLDHPQYSAGPLVYDRYERIGGEWLCTTEMYASGTKVHIPPSDGHSLPAWIAAQTDKPASTAIPYWGHWHKFLKYYYAKDAVLWTADATGWGGAFGDRMSVLPAVKAAGPYGDVVQYHVKKYVEIGDAVHTLWTATMSGKPLTTFYARFDLDREAGKYMITSEVLSVGS